MPAHLIFFDGDCPFCSQTVRFVYGADRKKIFYFAPLQGETAHRELGGPQKLNTLVLLQNFGTDQEKKFIEGKGALRILWLLGGGYAWIGSLSFLPSFLFDIIYRMIVRYRNRLFSNKPLLQKKDDRFLP
ncbi:MAG: DUF393 domain-containing protein [Chlamydiales bacterium]